MAITRIRLKNFRCIQELDLKLPPFAAIIGPNGAGKSTLLGAFRAMHSLTTEALAQTFSVYGGYQATTCWRTASSRIELGATVETKSSTLAYSAALDGVGYAYYVANEELQYAPSGSSAGPHPVVSLLSEPSDGALSIRKSAGPGHLLRTLGGQVFWVQGDNLNEQDRHAGPECFLPQLAGENLFHDVLFNLAWITVRDATDVVLGQLRRPQPLEPARLPSPQGENLFSVLYGLKAEKRSCYDDLLETLQVAFPELESLELPLAGKGFASLNWFQKGMPRPLDAQQLSDGSLRMLWLVTLLYTVPDDSFVLIDEPEISLHPQWLQLLASLMRKMSSRVQILVATHSDQFIRWLEPNELLVADIEDGVSRFRWGHEMNLDEWLKDYTLDRLWLMGEIGGRR
jgi:predicted ATPase